MATFPTVALVPIYSASPGNTDIPQAPTAGTLDEFPTLTRIGITDLVGPVAANMQEKSLERRTWTTRDRINALITGYNNLATYFLQRDGSTVPTANLPMGADGSGAGGYKLIFLAPGSSPYDSVRYDQITPLAPKASPVFSGTITAPTASVDFSTAAQVRVPTVSPGDNSTLAASTAFVMAAVASTGAGFVFRVITTSQTFTVNRAGTYRAFLVGGGGGGGAGYSPGALYPAMGGGGAGAGGVTEATLQLAAGGQSVAIGGGGAGGGSDPSGPSGGTGGTTSMTVSGVGVSAAGGGGGVGGAYTPSTVPGGGGSGAAYGIGFGSVSDTPSGGSGGFSSAGSGGGANGSGNTGGAGGSGIAGWTGAGGGGAGGLVLNVTGGGYAITGGSTPSDGNYGVASGGRGFGAGGAGGGAVKTAGLGQSGGAGATGALILIWPGNAADITSV